MNLEDEVPIVGCYRPAEAGMFAWMIIPAILFTMAGSLAIAYAYPKLDTADPYNIQQVYTAEQIAAGQHQPERRLQFRGDDSVMSFVWPVFGIGFLLIILGPGSLILGLRRRLQDDRYLMLRVDGLIHERGPEGQQTLLWERVEKVRFDSASNAIEFALRNGDTLRIGDDFAGITNRELAREAEDIRRKSSFGLI